MKKITLGKTKLKVSQLGLGIGGILGMKIFNENKAIRLIEKSIDNGVNLFDTGNSYSYGNAELVLGKALNKKNLDKIVISTKGGTVLSKNNRLYKDFSKNSLKSHLEQSLKKLNIEKVNLFQLHSPNINDLNEEVYETILILKEEGKIDHYGISCDGDVLEHVIKTDFFETVMCTYNIINRKAENQLFNAKQNNIGTIIKSPMAHRVYSNKIFKIHDIPSLWYLLRILKNYRSQLFKSYKYRFINQVEGFSSSEIALNFVTDNSNVDVAMISTTKLSHLIENINAVNKTIPPNIKKMIKNIR